MQRWVKEASEAYALSGDVVSRYIDVTAEVGELGKEILRGSGYGRGPLRLADAFEEEMGDCLFALLSLCEAAGIDAEAALRKAIDKYGRRWRERGGIGSEGKEG